MKRIVSAAIIAALLALGIVAAHAQTLGPARRTPSILYKSDGTEVSYLGTVAHDAAAASIDPFLTGCWASAAAPSDVSADNDAVRAWCLRNGARAIQPTFAGVLWSTGNGVAGTGTPRVTIASDNTAFSVNIQTNASTNLNQIGGNAISTGNGTSGTGVQRVTLASDSTGQVALASGSNTVGNVGVLPVTSGGLSTCYVTSAASNNATNCKASAGQVYAIQVVNTTSTIYYLRMYNLASAPTCSSATGFVRSIPIPHASGAGAGVGFNQDPGAAFGTGIGFCLTGGGSSTDNTNAATGVYISILYK